MVSENSSHKKNTAQTEASDVDSLAEQIKTLARNGSFQEAEQLREQLMQTNPMALGSIVSTAEVIEEEKTNRVDPDHIAAWSDLYNELSSEETNLLYYHLKRVKIGAGKLLIAQGKPNSRLFFLESGQVTLYYQKRGKKFAVSKHSTGDILGEDSFFGISLCPFSAATQSDVFVWYLNRMIADDWRENQSGLYGKIADFCRKHGVGERTSEQKSSGRREHRRYPLAGSVTAIVLDEQRARTAAYFKGELSDVSRSGACFSIRCSRQQTARALLSKELELSITLDEEKDKKIEMVGTIVKLSYHLHSDYFVHLKFTEIIEIDLFKTFPCDWSAREKL